MQLLLEEFFGKILNFINSLNTFLFKIILKIFFYVILISFLIFMLYLFYVKKYFLILIIFGMIIIAEISHFIRKTREKIMIKRISRRNFYKKNKKQIPKNKNLLKYNRIKNKNLLKINKPKNKKLLKL